MTKIRLIGDVHAKWGHYLDLITDKECPRRTIQLGDFGYGFFNGEEMERYVSSVEGEHKFIRGNHDNPDLCWESPFHLGDWGFDTDESMFWVGGADSIDKDFRTPGVSWWSEEQLDEDSLEDAFNFYVKTKPKLMLTHDCPWSLYTDSLTYKNLAPPSRTALWLQKMFEEHQPERWYFGHHHKSLKFENNGCKFTCLNELEYEDIEI